jgi:hypothetical protein
MRSFFLLVNQVLGKHYSNVSKKKLCNLLDSHRRLPVRTKCCWALAAFPDNEKARAALEKGLNVKELQNTCRGVLYSITKDTKYIQELQEQVERDQDVDLYELGNLQRRMPDDALINDMYNKANTAQQEKKRKQAEADELGIENWQPSEEQLKVKHPLLLPLTHKHIIHIANDRYQQSRLGPLQGATAALHYI